MRMRLVILWTTLLLALGWFNWQVWQKEQVIAAGTTVFLELRPVDPRSLIQGDYMALAYNLATEVDFVNLPPRGRLVLTLDERNIGRFDRLYTPGEALAANEQLLRYAKRDNQLSFGADAYFFEEGQAAVFDRARYGELRVGASGDSVLVGLRDAGLNRLEPRVDNDASNR